MSRGTTLLRLALVAPLSGAALLVAAAPASAAIVTPGAGTTYTSDTTVAIEATVPQSSSQSTLVLKGPDGSSRTLATSGSRDSLGRYPAQTLRGSLDTDCASADCSPGQVKPARNGTWTVQLAGAQSDSKAFTLKVPPKAPTSVRAQTTAFREITLSWTRGSEPDLSGFTVYDGNGAVVRDGIGTGACSGTSCSTTLAYGDDDSGERSFRLRAHRTAGPGSSEIVDSAQSDSASATLEAKPQPTPEPTPTGGTGGSDPGTTGGDPGSSTGSDPGTTGGSDPGTTGGSAGGSGSSGSSTSGSGGSTSGTSGSTSGSSPRPQAIGTGSTSDSKALEQRRAFALTFRAFAPKLGIPKLQPLPKLQAPVVGEAPLEDGTFEGTLGYDEQEVEEKVSILGSRRIGGAVNGALDSEQFMRFVAAALVMVLTAAHLRRWLGATAPDEV
jgi:hypothetical protein